MICKINETVGRFEMLKKGDCVAVGFSGGADSVCLLHFLSKLRDEGYIDLKAVHVNHNIRGDEALRDESFVRQFCQNYCIPLQVFSMDVPRLAEERKLGLEECGREVRYECFHKVQCDKIAVAHTLSDSIETVIFNLARGTGIKGVCGITPVRGKIIRPLIDLTRAEIEKYCLDNSLSYVTDSTNLTDDYTRNAIRHKIVPVLKEINPSFERAFSRFRDSADESVSFIKSSAEALISDARLSDAYCLSVLQNTHEAVLSEAVSMLISAHLKKPVEGKHIRLCCEAILKGSGAVELSKNAFFTVKNQQVYIHSGEIHTVPGWKVQLIDGIFKTPYGEYALKLRRKEDFNGRKENLFDAAKVGTHLFMRSREDGDKITLLKRKCTKSLKKLFIEEKISAEKRNTIAVLSDGENNVIWVDGFGVNATCAVSDETEIIYEIIKIQERKTQTQ